jgi:hypothetical protein
MAAQEGRTYDSPVRARSPVLLAAGAVAALTGCGGLTHQQSAQVARSATSRPNDAQGGYLAQTWNGVAFVRFQRIGNAVEGTFSEAYYDPSDPTRLNKQQADFSGTISGSTISMQLDSGSIWTGTVSRSRLTLASLVLGTRSKIRFHAASVAAYKSALAALTSR